MIMNFLKIRQKKKTKKQNTNEEAEIVNETEAEDNVIAIDTDKVNENIAFSLKEDQNKPKKAMTDLLLLIL